MAGWLRAVIGSAIGDEVGVQSDPVQPRVLVAPVDADPVGNLFGVQRGAHGGRQLLNAGIGLVVTVGAYGLYNYGVSRLPASQASGFTNLIPVFTLIFAALLLGESLSPLQYLAAALVFVGVALSQWRSSVPPPAGILD